MTLLSPARTTKISDAVTLGHTLPVELYTSDKAFQIDMDVFFYKSWILVGYEADIPEAGDARTVEVGSASVLLVRDDDENVRAFHNSCRHRGSRLVEDRVEGVSRFVCPYHQWTYDLEGNLVHAPHMGQTFDKTCHNLRSVHVRTAGGMVFICLAEDAPSDIDEVVAELDARLAPFDLANAKIAFDQTIVEEGNWKLSVDNNRECYHCEGSHPELINTFVGLDIGFDPDEVAPEELRDYERHCVDASARVAEWEARGYVSHAVERYAGHETMLRTQRFVISGAGQSHTLTGAAAVRKLLGDNTDPTLGDLHIHLSNAWHHAFADHAVFSYLIPISPSRTELRTVWLVNKDAVEGVDYVLDRLTEVWIATNRQDADLVALAQKGVQSFGYTPGPLSPFTERTVAVNQEWYVERLRAHGY